MKKGILATKVGMTQIWNDKGEIIPVTVLNAGPCTVLQIKTKDTDGYDAIQVGFGDIREKLLNKPQLGHLKKSKQIFSKTAISLMQAVFQKEKVSKVQLSVLVNTEDQ